MKTLKEQLDYDKLKINWNKNPIRMDLFLSFITVDVEKNGDCFSSRNGWTEWTLQEIKAEYAKMKDGWYISYSAKKIINNCLKSFE